MAENVTTAAALSSSSRSEETRAPHPQAGTSAVPLQDDIKSPFHGIHPPPCNDAKSLPHRPWMLPTRRLAVFHGGGDTPRLSHYFLPRLVLQGKRVLILDGANCADPRLLERLARQRGVPFEQFSRQIQIARAFTCFQLTELIARVPRLLSGFPAEALIVTAFPELYYDEDVRDWNARVAFEQALANLRQWALPPREGTCSARRSGFRAGPALRDAGLRVGTPEGDGAALKASATPLTIALFSSATTFTPSPARRRFFAQACALATEVWKFSLGENSRLQLICEHAPCPPAIAMGAAPTPARRPVLPGNSASSTAAR
jgi:hypothetical protein